MKLRTIFILFNAVIAVSFLFVFLLPFFLLGADYSLEFWRGNWPLALFFVAILLVLNGFFLANWRIFTLVEKEDWSGLSAHLVRLIFAKKRYGSRHVSLLVDAYLLLSEVEGIERLEAELAANRPELLRKNAVLFGLTRLLRNRPAEAESFLAPYLGAKDAEKRDWLRFDYAFSLVLQRKLAPALPYLREGASSRDAVLSLLSAYLLGHLGAASAGSEAERKELETLADSVRSSLKKRFPGERWKTEVERAKGEFQVVVLSKLIDDAGSWLGEAGAKGAEGPAGGSGGKAGSPADGESGGGKS